MRITHFLKGDNKIQLHDKQIFNKAIVQSHRDRKEPAHGCSVFSIGRGNLQGQMCLVEARLLLHMKLTTVLLQSCLGGTLFV